MPASVEEENRCRWYCNAGLAGARKEMASQMRRVRGEVMGALSLVLAKCGLGI